MDKINYTTKEGQYQAGVKAVKLVHSNSERNRNRANRVELLALLAQVENHKINLRKYWQEGINDALKKLDK
jgi:hypothetical protein